ncbi:putative porin [Leptospira sarikeiensis]|uniref:Putative porin n=1 Tax=Leptospira sarikeiensis TaxID=2484943 RepID=A0A4R9JZT9_9LEPT|nr:putative porin [Leptospira sarikeiensis]TGL58902.1 putative porin [Leptospira sarikeiensis]
MKIKTYFISLLVLLISFSNLYPQGSEPEKQPEPEIQAQTKSPDQTTIQKFLSEMMTRTSITGLFGENGGQHIFESGTKYPNLSGIKAGSRITYNREFQYGGIGIKHWWEGWEFGLEYRTTFKNQRAGEGRDEDFFLGSVSRERGTKIDFPNLSFNDTPYTFTGTQNFADGRGKLKMKDDRISLQARKYFGTANPDPRKPGSGVYISAGAHYTFFKYYLYDVTQWIATAPVTYGPIGIGLSYSNSTWELPVGIGYRYSDGTWIFEAGLAGNVWYSHFRDYHYQRNLNFIGDSSGYGIEANLGAGYALPSWLFYVKLTEHRLYGEGSFKTQGGINRDDIISNYSGMYRNYLSTKQFSLEFQVSHFL